MGQNVWHFVLGGSLAFVPKNEIMRATEINRNTFLLSDWLEEEKKNLYGNKTRSLPY